MITDKTVFILGAGASKPYGFPTALELRKNIIYDFPKMFIRAHSEFNSVEESKVDLPKKYQDLISSFKDSSTTSIDLFLSRNKGYRDIGKKMIAFLISHFEKNSKFRDDVDEPKYDWYMHFYNVLTRETSNSDELESIFEKNQVSFITFNYDRSLEQFLYESFFNSFISKRNEIVKLFYKIKFIHIYGKIAPLPFDSDNFHIHYGSPDYYVYLEDLANNIKIVFEERNEDLNEAKQLISEAQNIYFLGFGYADENLKALDFTNQLNSNHRIFGTGLGFTEKERRRIANRLKGQNRSVYLEAISIDDCDSVMLLRQYL